jgi:hypothetical protein
MDTMGIVRINALIHRQNSSLKYAVVVFVAGSILSFTGDARSNTEIIPVFSIKETLVDNEEGGTSDSGYITTIAPGIIVEREGPRSTLSLDYQLNAVYNGRFDESEDRTVHLLEFFTDYQHSPGKWISSLRANSRLTNIDVNGRQNVNPEFSDDNTTELRTFLADTELTDTLGDSVNYRTRAFINYATYADSDDGDGTAGKGLLFELDNFRSQADFTWRTELTSVLLEDGIDETQLDTFNAILNYRVSSNWSSFVDYTRTELDSPQLEDDKTLLGVTWAPNRRSFISFGAGKRVINEEKDDTYSLEARLERKRATYSVTYDDDITTARASAFRDVDLSRSTTQSISIVPVRQKRAAANIEASGKHSTYRLSIFEFDRTGANIEDDETTAGLRLSYDYELSERDQFRARLLAEHIVAIETIDYWDLVATYSRRLTKSETMDVELGWGEQESTNVGDEFKRVFMSAQYRVTF